MDRHYGTNWFQDQKQIRCSRSLQSHGPPPIQSQIFKYKISRDQLYPIYLHTCKWNKSGNTTGLGMDELSTQLSNYFWSLIGTKVYIYLKKIIPTPFSQLWPSEVTRLHEYILGVHLWPWRGRKEEQESPSLVDKPQKASVLCANEYLERAMKYEKTWVHWLHVVVWITSGGFITWRWRVFRK